MVRHFVIAFRVGMYLGTVMFGYKATCQAAGALCFGIAWLLRHA